MIPQFDSWGEIKETKEKKIEHSFKATPLQLHSRGKTPPLQHHTASQSQQISLQRLHFCCQPTSGHEAFSKAWDYRTAGSHTAHQEPIFVIETEEKTRKWDAWSGRRRNTSDSTFSGNPCAFCYAHLLCSTPEQVHSTDYSMELSKILHRDSRYLDQQVTCFTLKCLSF